MITNFENASFIPCNALCCSSKYSKMIATKQCYPTNPWPPNVLLHTKLHTNQKKLVNVITKPPQDICGIISSTNTNFNNGNINLEWKNCEKKAEVKFKSYDDNTNLFM